jgi:hypothetical protein
MPMQRKNGKLGKIMAPSLGRQNSVKSPATSGQKGGMNGTEMGQKVGLSWIPMVSYSGKWRLLGNFVFDG